jgi:mono/diheme cytochrome c family protein
MAGYFRYYGAGGQYNKTNLSFDDGKVIGGTELEKYLSNWRAEGGSRQWNVGYIRSNTDPRKNHFGDDLKDLFAFIKTAPEVRQCLVKRLAKYYVSDSQAFDGDWLAQLGKPLQQAPQSGAALKQVIAGLIASNSFAAADPKADQCYDYVGGAPTSPVPCAVAHILKEKCSACHSADNAEGGLDLTNWRNGSFPHIRKGQPVSKADTIATIQERIDSANPDLLMPQSGELSAQERQALFSWLQSQQGGAQ